MRKDRALFFVATFAFALTACGGGGGTSGPALPPATGGGGGTQMSAQVQQQNSVAATDAAGAPVEDVTGLENTINDPLTLQASVRQVAEAAAASPTPGTSPSPGPTAPPSPPPNGTCVPNFFGGGPYQGFQYWKPDKAGEPNSVEYIFFYDAACTQIAKDHKRVTGTVTGTAPAQTQTQTVTNTEYDKGNAVPTSSSTETNTITGTFNAEGYPVLKNGFSRRSVNSLSEGGSVILNRSSEYVASPYSSSSQSYCGDSAGFNTEHVTASGQIHGWQNLIANASRTKNADGSVTWTNSSAGSTFTATPPAAFSVNSGTFNTACPITTAAFTLSGGTLAASYGVQSMSATFKSGVLTNLTVTNATLANGFTLNIVTNPGVAGTSPNFITGTIANAGTTIATFNVDAAGNGTLTVAAGGAQFTMKHWHVVKDKPATPSPSPSSSASPSPSPSSSPH